MKRALKRGDVINVNSVLEHSSVTNTGFGSSLNAFGEVEIDASYIKSNGESGALSGLQSFSPTQELFRIYKEINELYKKQPNLTRPLSLHCSGLQKYMDIDVDDHLGSAKAKEIWMGYSGRQDQYPVEGAISDTIGSIVINSNDTTLATTSGGNFFKLPGRIGCAGIVGAAIYYEKIGDLEISCMCSGNGEQIIKYSLAQLIVTNVHLMDEGKYGPQLEKLLIGKDKDLYCGFVIVLKKSDGRIHLLYGHTTETFYFGTRVNDSTSVVLSCAEKEGKFTFGEYKLQ
ncbi:hypothetical protein KGF57_004038 [Candida theae]|uniref:L-asparaginase n=1 Tax=Candida theae TaxID=1198502 RepID=A0AAD5FXG7_9ASCO|nr:uncharacterized protein KGF57_004038 [Candida theae]KAI5953046.1 hypothetical protein KGF57_004038 [Candida theae]